MEFLVGLSKFVKCIRKNKIYRWASYIICVVVGFKVYCYLHEIIAHTIIHTPVWMWGIIPVITILVLLLTIGIKKISVLLSILGGRLLWNSYYWHTKHFVLYDKLLVRQFPNIPS